MKKIVTSLLILFSLGSAYTEQPALVFNMGPTSQSDPDGDCTPANGNNITWQQDVVWPDPRFITDSSGQCEIDRLTGLMWLKTPSTATYTWNSNAEGGSAQAYIDELNAENGTCGYKDWRLPNVLELNSLINYCDPSGAGAYLNSVGFSDVQSDFYWSSTPVVLAGRAQSTFAYDVNIGVAPNTNGISMDFIVNGHYAWAVRGGSNS